MTTALRSKDYYDGLLDGVFGPTQDRLPLDSRAIQYLLHVYWPEVTLDTDMTLTRDTMSIRTYTPIRAGGMYVGSTQPIVRVTHRPTGLWAESQDARSQHQNKQRAVAKLDQYLKQFRSNA